MRGGGSSAAWIAGPLDLAPPTVGPLPWTRPRPGAALAVCGRGWGVPGRRKSLSPLPQAARDAGECRALAAGALVFPTAESLSRGSRCRVRPRASGGWWGSSHSLQNTLPVVRRGPVGEGAQLQKERRNLGGGCDCASAACFESGCATLGTSHFALSLSAILRSVDSVSSRV